MTPKSYDMDEMLDRTVEQIRASEPTSIMVAEAASRVWARLEAADATAHAAAEIGEIRDCGDYQALIPAYLADQLPAARRLLLEDHSRECVPCRRALMEAREGKPQTTVHRSRSKVVAFPRSMTRWALAAVLTAAVGATLYFLSGALLYGGSAGVVETVDGTLFRVTETAQLPLEPGAEVREGEVLRTGRGGSAVVRLEDGSRVEIRERSELSFDEARRGTTVELERGNVIVEAAPQRSRHLFVSTDDCLVSVTGTIFSVNHGTKGSRVSVIEGEVRVAWGGDESLVLPGEQVATDAKLGNVPVEDEISWSRKFDDYVDLLREFHQLRREIKARVPSPELRTGSRLLDLVADDTVFFAALPNLSEKVAMTHQVIRERIQASPILQQYWNEKIGGHDLEPMIEEIVGQLSELGEYLGDEIVAASEAPLDDDYVGPLVLAEIVDAAGFRAFVEDVGAGLVESDAFTEGEVVFLDDPFAPAPKADLYLWLTDDLVAISPDLGKITAVASIVLRGEENPFVGSDFHRQIAALYKEGVEVVVALDLEEVLSAAFNQVVPEDGQDLATFERLGVLDAQHVLAEQKTLDKTYHRAVVTFKQKRRGVVAWLDEPAPMGSLDFITPDAKAAAIFLTQDPARLFDDLHALLPWEDTYDDVVRLFEERYGFSLRDDFLAVLGGEIALAVDGPLVPKPSWKLVVELYDPARFQWIIEQAISEANVMVQLEGKPPFTLESAEVGGRTFYTLTTRAFEVEFSFAYTYVDGYLVVAPSRALLDQAIRARESGFTLGHAPRFTELLPVDGRNNFSALVYQDLTGALAELTGKLAGDQLSAEQKQLIDEVRQASKPSLGYAYGEEDRIIFAASSDMDMMSSVLTGMLGLGEGPMGFFNLLDEVEGLGF